MDRKIIISIENLFKSYGKVKAVNNLSLDIVEGEIFGFLGPNGAGKTTTIRVLMGQIFKDKGEYSILGKKSHEINSELFRDIGYVSGEGYLLPNYTGRELLQYFADILGLENGYYKELADLFELDLGRKIKTLSSGNKQKVALIQAFMKRPKLLILDEPTTGLDPILQKNVYDLLFEFKESGGTVFFSSHIMSEVEKVCDRVGIIRKGELVKVSTIHELHSEIDMYNVSLYSTDEAGLRTLEKQPEVLEWSHLLDKVNLKYKGSANMLLKNLTSIQIEDLQISEPTLEEIFLSFYEGEHNE